MARSLRWADEAAKRGDHSDALAWLHVIERAGAEVDSIDAAIIAPAPLDEEQKSVLWLYAQALQERRSDRMLTAREPALNEI